MSRAHDSQVVLLTGAAHGIGRATAAALAGQGFRLALIDRDQEPLEALIKELRSTGAPAIAQVADVRDRESVQCSVVRLAEQAGAIDVVVACAGVGGLTSIHNLDTEGLRAMLEVNVLGVAHTIEAVLPEMLRRGTGHIVGISSVAGYRGLPWTASYSASKAALSTYLEGLRPALKRRGISVTTVCPGFVRTAMTADTPFRKPVPMMEPEQAAKYLVRAILKRPRDYAFPWSTALGMAVLRNLPNLLFDRMMERAGPQALTTEF
jgi:short-subunit dehydrogenase